MALAQTTGQGWRENRQEYAAYRAIMEATARRLAPEPQPTDGPHLREPRGFVFIGMYTVPIERRPSIREIQAKVASFYNIPLIEMTSARRSRVVVRPRQVAMYLSKELTLNSLPQIGRKFGGRDHTTVIHALRQVEFLRKNEDGIDHDILELAAALAPYSVRLRKEAGQ